MTVFQKVHHLFGEAKELNWSSCSAWNVGDDARHAVDTCEEIRESERKDSIHRQKLSIKKDFMPLEFLSCENTWTEKSVDLQELATENVEHPGRQGTRVEVILVGTAAADVATVWVVGLLMWSVLTDTHL